MNTTAVQQVLAFFSNEPMLGRLFLGSIETAFLSALVWAAIRIRLVRSPRWQSVLWLIVLMKAIVAITFGAAAPVLRLESAAPATLSREIPVEAASNRADPALVTPFTDMAKEHQASDTQELAASPQTTTRPTRAPWRIGQILMALWGTGLLLCAGYAIIDRFRLYRLVLSSHQAPESLLNRYANLAQALRVKTIPNLRVTEVLESPALVGIIWPTILVPAWLTEDQWRPKLEWALRHELMHWKLLDPLANLVRQVAQTLLFFHPAIWWVGSRWQESAELACDRSLVNTDDEVEEYAGNLYEVLAQVHNQRRLVFAGGLFATRTQIGRRIAALLGEPLRYRARLGTWGVLVFAVVAAIALASGGTFAMGQEAVTSKDVSPEVQQHIQQAIDILCKTSEFERDKIKNVFDIVRAQPNEPALLALCEWLKSDAATKRRSAIFILGALPWDDAGPALPPLRALLNHEEAMTRGMAALTLGTLEDGESYDAIVHTMRDDRDPYARRCAAYALGDLAELKALDPLQAALQDPDDNVKNNARNAVDRLTFLKDHAQATGDAKQVVRGIWLIAGTVPWDNDRLDRAVALIRGANPEARKAILAEAASSSSEAIKNSARYALEKATDPAEDEEALRPAAEPAQQDASPDVQKTVQLAIGILSQTSDLEVEKVQNVLELIRALPNRPALSALCEWLEDDTATKRRSAIYILGALSWEDADSSFPPLRALLSHEEAMTRGMTALALAMLGDKESYGALVNMMRDDKDAYARRCAAWALGELGDPKALEPLQAALQDPDPNVKRNAQNAIERLTFLDEHAEAAGDARQVVRGIWLVAGMPPKAVPPGGLAVARRERGLAWIRSAEPSVRKTILDEAASSSSEAIRTSAQYAVDEVGDAAK
ncbi:MAG TPA: HEAT repeat domain-containing protein [Candidatus Hydrogenedentes bacterium]|nr:HEAT repeat domain-containing protein [Candidatus Hydrogenedentota bacterium]HPG68652.1 HEAT repeat domain-containing protein [Candidatus Hydrogenedentota bacterium]